MQLHMSAHEVTWWCRRREALPTPLFCNLETVGSHCNALEHLESTGTEVFYE